MQKEEQPELNILPAATTTTQEISEAPYTIYTVMQRRSLVCLLGYLALASSLTAQIYFPLIDILADRYHTSVQSIDLTITIYFVFQGISPAFWSSLSDLFGRRPVYFITFSIYTISSLVLSVTDRKYAVLLVLRALQSFGASSVLSLAYAVVSDVIVHSERGTYLAPMMTTTNVGPSLGPIIGGAVAVGLRDPKWCFRILAIFGGSSLLSIGFLLPETNRNIVGNGQVSPSSIWKTWWSLMPQNYARHTTNRLTSLMRRQNEEGNPRETENLPEKQAAVTVRADGTPTGRGRLIVPNPFLALRIVLYADAFLILWLAATPYALWFCVQTSLTPIFHDHYAYNALIVGLCFLAGGIGIITGGFGAGWLMDRNYSHTAKKAGVSIDRARGDDMSTFPIEHARSCGSYILITINLCLFAGYGWAVQERAHPALLLILQGILGCVCTIIHQIYSALIVDIFAGKTGTAAAANNIVRCALAGVYVAVLNPIERTIGYGWYFLTFGLFNATTSLIAVVLLRKYGQTWRSRRHD